MQPFYCSWLHCFWLHRFIKSCASFGNPNSNLEELLNALLSSNAVQFYEPNIFEENKKEFKKQQRNW